MGKSLMHKTDWIVVVVMGTLVLFTAILAGIGIYLSNKFILGIACCLLGIMIFWYVVDTLWYVIFR